jgi:hypothetical protein
MLRCCFVYQRHTVEKVVVVKINKGKPQVTQGSLSKLTGKLEVLVIGYGEQASGINALEGQSNEEMVQMIAACISAFMLTNACCALVLSSIFSISIVSCSFDSLNVCLNKLISLGAILDSPLIQRSRSHLNKKILLSSAVAGINSRIICTLTGKLEVRVIGYGEQASGINALEGQSNEEMVQMIRELIPATAELSKIFLFKCERDRCINGESTFCCMLSVVVSLTT